MKKYLLFLSVLTLLPTITACQDTEHSVIAIKNLDNKLTAIELSKNELVNLIDNGQDFLLDVYSPYCEHCVYLSSLLSKYISETKNVLYSFDFTTVDAEEFRFWHETYPDIFVDQYVPSLKFISKGKLTYQVGNEKHESYRTLKSILNKHFISSLINISSNLEAINEFGANNPERILFAYDVDNQISIKIAAENIITKSYAKKNDVLLINKKDMGVDFDTLKHNYNVEYDTFIIKVENEKWESVDYSTSSFNFSDFNLIL